MDHGQYQQPGNEVSRTITVEISGGGGGPGNANANSRCTGQWLRLANSINR